MSVSVFLRALVPAVAVLGVLCGCSTAPGQPQPSASPSGASAAATSAAVTTPTPNTSPTGTHLEQVLAWGRRLAQCARDHGMATFPDPSQAVMGRTAIADPDFPGVPKEDIVRAMDLCPEVVRDFPRPAPPGPPSATVLQRMRQYAECMRDRGLADFPDPRADGTFPIAGTPYAALAPFVQLTLTEQLLNADNYCRRYQVGWYVRAS